MSQDYLKRTEQLNARFQMATSVQKIELANTLRDMLRNPYMHKDVQALIKVDPKLGANMLAQSIKPLADAMVAAKTPAENQALSDVLSGVLHHGSMQCSLEMTLDNDQGIAMLGSDFVLVRPVHDKHRIDIYATNGAFCQLGCTLVQESEINNHRPNRSLLTEFAANQINVADLRSNHTKRETYYHAMHEGIKVYFAENNVDTAVDVTPKRPLSQSYIVPLGARSKLNTPA